MRMQKIGNPPCRIVLRRRGRKSIIERRTPGRGFFKPETERHRGFGRHCYGAFQRVRVFFRSVTSFFGQSMRPSGERRAASHASCALSTTGCVRGTHDVLEVLVWFFVSDSACGMAERTRASTISVIKARRTEAAAVEGGALPSALVKALADGGMAEAKAAKRSYPSAVITGSHTEWQ